MSGDLIPQDALNAAFEHLADQDETEKAAAAKAKLERLQFKRQRVESRLFLKHTGTNLERQAKARAQR